MADDGHQKWRRIMLGWQFTAVGTPLTLAEAPEPSPRSGQVVVDVKAAGICHSDVGFVDGHISSMLEFSPIVLGHEVAGVISELGPDVTGWQVGDRVGIAGLGLDAPGIRQDGGFAPKTIGKVDQLVRIPDGVAFDQAAAGTDAGLTSYHAVVTVGGAAPGTTVGIIGLGGLGLTGARIAVLKGARVVAAEIDDETRQLGLDRGVSEVVSDATELAQFEPDVIIDFAGFGTTTAAAVEAVKPGGRVVQVGLGRGESTISTNTLVSHQVQLVGSLGGLKSDAEGVFELLSTGELEIMTTVVPFDQIGAGIDRLRGGGVRGRLVADVTTA